MKLSVIIVNFNVRYFLEQALLSVREAGKRLDVEVFVVDNNSRDDSVQMVREKFPEVQLIENPDNPGFSRANNQAIRQTKGEYILLLNPDTVVEEDTFRKCLDFMDAHPDAGGLGVKMIDGSGKFLPESKRAFPSPWVAFCKSFGLSSLFPRSRTFNRYHLGYLDPDAVHQVDVLAGAFMLLRRSVLEEIGLLDESFFMYGEDIDLSYRIIRAGYHNYYYPETTIIHYKGESTRKGSLNYVRVFYRAMIIFARKHFRGSKAWLFILLLQAAIWFRALLTLLKNAFKRLWLPLADAALITLGMLLLKDFWGTYYFQDPGYFDQARFYFFNIPLYTGVWLFSLYFNGAYDHVFRLRRTASGILFGTLVLAAIYGFLPLDYRFSRALVILGAVWAMIAAFSLRTLLHLVRFRSLRIGQERERRLVIVGSSAESDRVLGLLQQAEVNKNFIGVVSPEEFPDKDRYLGSIYVLDDLVHIYRVDEIIFCAADVPSQSIMDWMSRLGPKVNFKILPRESISIIGSSSRNAPGELYTVDVQYAIDDPANRRKKRLLDVLLGLFLLISFPFWVLVLGRRLPGMVVNAVRVILGHRSWVGYSTRFGPVDSLPALRPGLLSPLDAFRKKDWDAATVQRLNFRYAKDYEADRDLEIVWRGRKKLGDQLSPHTFS